MTDQQIRERVSKHMKRFGSISYDPELNSRGMNWEIKDRMSDEDAERCVEVGTMRSTGPGSSFVRVSYRHSRLWTTLFIDWGYDI